MGARPLLPRPSSGRIWSARLRRVPHPQQQPLIDALTTAAPSGIRELHATAPDHDEHAEALAQLIARLAPAGPLHLYSGARTNVDGASLRRVVEAKSCEVVVLALRSDDGDVRGHGG